MARIWFVTGSSRGMGCSIAEAVLAAGDRLVATARDATRLADLVERYGENVCPVTLDVTGEVGVRAAMRTALDAVGRIDVVINEALCVLAEETASAEDIDHGMKLGCDQPIGPLALADMISLDVCLAIMDGLSGQLWRSLVPALSAHACVSWWLPDTWAARPGEVSMSTELHLLLSGKG